ncbi:hypothetical protein M885DRAFT_520607 [Pelagophyceae sp. CCMP2097]|nr:hypothetical protein M885DRAFT_520607 [Pelagophyceae sp. CCMP2097]
MSDSLEAPDGAASAGVGDGSDAHFFAVVLNATRTQEELWASLNGSSVWSSEYWWLLMGAIQPSSPNGAPDEVGLASLRLGDNAEPEAVEVLLQKLKQHLHPGPDSVVGAVRAFADYEDWLGAVHAAQRPVSPDYSEDVDTDDEDDDALDGPTDPNALEAGLREAEAAEAELRLLPAYASPTRRDVDAERAGLSPTSFAKRSLPMFRVGAFSSVEWDSRAAAAASFARPDASCVSSVADDFARPSDWDLRPRNEVEAADLKAADAAEAEERLLSTAFLFGRSASVAEALGPSVAEALGPARSGTRPEAAHGFSETAEGSSETPEVGAAAPPEVSAATSAATAAAAEAASLRRSLQAIAAGHARRVAEMAALHATNDGAAAAHHAERVLAADLEAEDHVHRARSRAASDATEARDDDAGEDDASEDDAGSDDGDDYGEKEDDADADDAEARLRERIVEMKLATADVIGRQRKASATADTAASLRAEQARAAGRVADEQLRRFRAREADERAGPAGDDDDDTEATESADDERFATDDDEERSTYARTWERILEEELAAAHLLRRDDEALAAADAQRLSHWSDAAPRAADAGPRADALLFAQGAAAADAHAHRDWPSTPGAVRDDAAMDAALVALLTAPVDAPAAHVQLALAAATLRRPGDGLEGAALSQAGDGVAEDVDRILEAFGLSKDQGRAFAESVFAASADFAASLDAPPEAAADASLAHVSRALGLDTRIEAPPLTPQGDSDDDRGPSSPPTFMTEVQYPDDDASRGRALSYDDALDAVGVYGSEDDETHLAGHDGPVYGGVYGKDDHDAVYGGSRKDSVDDVSPDESAYEPSESAYEPYEPRAESAYEPRAYFAAAAVSPPRASTRRAEPLDADALLWSRAWLAEAPPPARAPKPTLDDIATKYLREAGSSLLPPATSPQRPARSAPRPAISLQRPAAPPPAPQPMRHAPPAPQPTRRAPPAAQPTRRLPPPAPQPPRPPRETVVRHALNVDGIYHHLGQRLQDNDAKLEQILARCAQRQL